MEKRKVIDSKLQLNLKRNEFRILLRVENENAPVTINVKDNLTFSICMAILKSKDPVIEDHNSEDVLTTDN